jgi:hypothetical protein
MFVGRLEVCVASVLAWFGDGVEREPIADGLLSRPRLIWVDVVRFDLRFLGKPPGFFINVLILDWIYWGGGLRTIPTLTYRYVYVLTIEGSVG